MLIKGFFGGEKGRKGFSTTSFDFYGSLFCKHNESGWKMYLNQRLCGGDRFVLVDEKASVKNRQYNRGLIVGLEAILVDIQNAENVDKSLTTAVNQTIAYVNFMISVANSNDYDEEYCENRYRMIEEAFKTIYQVYVDNNRDRLVTLPRSIYSINFEGFEDVKDSIIEDDELKMIGVINGMFKGQQIGDFIKEYYPDATIEKLLDLYAGLKERGEGNASEVFTIIDANLGAGESDVASDVSEVSAASIVITATNLEKNGGSERGDSLKLAKEVVDKIAGLRNKILKLGERIAKIGSAVQKEKKEKVAQLQLEVADNKEAVEKHKTTLRNNTLFKDSITVGNLAWLISGGRSQHRINAVIDAVVHNNIHKLVIDNYVANMDVVLDLLQALRLNKDADDLFAELEIKKGSVAELRGYIEQCALGFTKIIVPFVDMESHLASDICEYARRSTKLREFSGVNDSRTNDFIQDCILRNRILEKVNSKYGLEFVTADYEIPANPDKTTMFVFEKECKLNFTVVYGGSDSDRRKISGTIEDDNIISMYREIKDKNSANSSSLCKKIRSHVFSYEDYSYLFGDRTPSVLDFNLSGYGGAKTVERIIKVLNDNYQKLRDVKKLAFYFGANVSDDPVELSGDSLEKLAYVMISAKGMEQFSMSGYKIGVFSCSTLDPAKVYGEQPYKDLDLSNTGQGANFGAGFNLLANGSCFFPNRSVLESLNLAGNELLLPALDQLPRLLKNNASTLKSIDLSYNDLSDPVAFKCIMETCFKECSGLQKLNLRGCNLSDESIETIGKYVKNRLSSEGVLNLYLDCNERISKNSGAAVQEWISSKIETQYLHTSLARSEFVLNVEDVRLG